MVNYCCIPNCNRNSRSHKHLNFYSLPKQKHRQKLWLKRACRDDLLDKDMDKLRKTLRFCSRHFAPNTIVNRHLSLDALPTVSLPGASDENEPDIVPESHEGIICDSCDKHVYGFRYKCVTCDNFDLCQKCEMLERHPQHYMLRIPKSIKFGLADDLIKKWRNLFLKEHIQPDCESSSDDEPVKKYITLNDSGIDLTEDVKNDIRSEISRAIREANEKIANTPPVQVVREKVTKQKTPIRRKVDVPIDNETIKVDQEIVVDEAEIGSAPELVFADALKFDQADVKPTVADSCEVAVPNSPYIAVETQPLLYVTLSNDLSQFMIELAPDSNATESNTIK
ncbi:uncharacterized protein LOC128199483 [Bicyclus anynana]|uniref:Uncharacterized protein LOC128199483 n=1 Tax=Bicyclus anynana TaxID=110368 RepID=A0ABM3M2V0_BICAN|nr:uncharacterized protein LOC128199483 [Bicyclus anynana]